MNNVELSLYLNDHCNLHCNYCNIDYSKDVIVNEEQVKTFILDNKENINFDYINLLGGEPSVIYSNQFLKFLYDNFNNIIVTTNLKDTKSIENLTNILDGKLSLMVSYNKEAHKELIYNIEKFDEYISRFSIVVTNENLKDLYNTVLFLSKYEKQILLSPETDKNLIGYDLDKEEFIKQLELIFDKRLEKYLTNYNRIKDDIKTDFEKCKKHSLIITKTGKISSCAYNAGVYKSSKEYTFGDLTTKIKDIKIDYPRIETKSFNGMDCKDCKKCHNYNCETRHMVNKDNRIQKQICEFHSIFYDFTVNHKYKSEVKSITIFMTEQCNMKCTYCFEKEFKNRVGKVSNKVIEKTLDLLFNNDDGETKTLTFFGGEPTLNIDGIRHALEYYLKLKENGLKSDIAFEINTNLLTLTDELIELFKEIRYHASFYISISCDGFKELNDKQRIDVNGNGTYDKVITNAKRLRQAFDENCKCTKVTLSKHTVLQNENIPFIEKICEEAWEQRDIFDNFSAAYITPGKGKHELITMENLQLISDFYNKKVIKMPEEKRDFINKYLEILNLNADTLNNYGFSICNVVDNQLSIRANGDIMPCHAFLDKIDENYNNVKIDNILKIDTKNFGFNFNSQWHKLLDIDNKIKNEEITIKSELGYECKNCMFKFMCHTCIANLKELKGNVLIKSKEHCMRTLNQAEILLKIKEIQGIKELKELQQKEDEIIQNITEGITSVGEIAVKNREVLTKLIKE